MLYIIWHFGVWRVEEKFYALLNKLMINRNYNHLLLVSTGIVSVVSKSLQAQLLGIQLAFN